MWRVGLALEWFVNVDHVPIIAGIRKGFFASEGIDLHVVEPVNHEAGMVLVSEGKLDFAITEPIHLPEAVDKGLNISAFGKYFVTGFGVMVKDYIKSIGDLRGKRIATPLGKYAKVIIKAMASNSGVPLDEQDFETYPVSYYLTDALLKGKADAAFAAFRNYEVVEAEMHGLKVNFFDFVEHGVPSYGYLVFVANRDNAKTNEELMISFLKAVKRSVEYTINNPDDALLEFFKEIPILDNELNRNIYRETIKCYTTDLSLNPVEWERLVEFAYINGLVNNRIKTDRIILNVNIS